MSGTLFFMPKSAEMALKGVVRSKVKIALLIENRMKTPIIEKRGRQNRI